MFPLESSALLSHAYSHYQFLSPRNSLIIRDTFLWINGHYTEIINMLIYKNVKLGTFWEAVPSSRSVQEYFGFWRLIWVLPIVHDSDRDSKN